MKVIGKNKFSNFLSKIIFKNNEIEIKFSIEKNEFLKNSDQHQSVREEEEPNLLIVYSKRRIILHKYK